MSRYYGGWAPYVPVAERRRKAEREIEKRRKAGHTVAPVRIVGRAIATTVWGRAWCDNMENYRDFESRLPRGRTYVRNGSVVDLQIALGRVTAVVSGSELYDVTITIKETPGPQWRSICVDCAGGIDSLVELLQGRFSQGVMERLCRQHGGLFPRPSDIRFSCSCPDHALMCKHVAAVLYGVGARLDLRPELLFRLRAVDEADLVAHVDAALPLAKQGPEAGRVLETDDVSALFGLEMAGPEIPAPEKPTGKPTAARARRATPASPAAASAATAAVPRTAGPARAFAGMTPAKPAPPKTSTAARKGLTKPDIPEREPAVVKATPPGKAVPKRSAAAKASSRPVVSGKAAAVVEVASGRKQELDAREQAGANRRAKTSAAVASPTALKVAAPSRARLPVSRSKAALVHKPLQKPVKWW